MSSVGVLRATAVIAATALVTLVLRWYQRQTRRMVEPRPPRDKCLFCLIGDGKFGGPLLYSDDQCAVFRDIAPAGDVSCSPLLRKRSLLKTTAGPLARRPTAAL